MWLQIGDMKEIINGTEICYQTEGEGSNKVLLLHGWGCNGKMMQPVADALKKDHRTLIIDFPGHGERGRPPEPWGIPEYSDCILELLKRLSFTPCSVIAHSFGCRIAAWLETEEPELFDKIVFTGAAGIRSKPSKETQKRLACYKRMKSYCETAGRIPFFKLPTRTILKQAAALPGRIMPPPSMSAILREASIR